MGNIKVIFWLNLLLKKCSISWLVAILKFTASFSVVYSMSIVPRHFLAYLYCMLCFVFFVYSSSSFPKNSSNENNHKATINFDIEAKPLSLALIEFCAQANATIVIDADDIKGVQSSPIIGPYAIEPALRKLLSLTYLDFNYDQVTREITLHIREVALPVPTVGASAFGGVFLNDPSIEEVLVAGIPHTVISSSPLNVPVSHSIHQSQALEKSHLNTLNQVESIVPSFLFMGAERKARSDISIRGVGVGALGNIGTNVRTPVYVDDIPVGRFSSLNQDLTDIQQIEILKGPQGALFGANTIVGAVKIVTRKPQENFFLKLSSELGSYAHQKNSFIINVPLSDTFFTRVHYDKVSNDGFIENVSPQSTLDGLKRDSARFQLRYLGLDKLDLNFSFDWLDEYSSSTYGKAINLDASQVASDLTENDLDSFGLTGSGLKVSDRIKMIAIVLQCEQKLPEYGEVCRNIPDISKSLKSPLDDSMVGKYEVAHDAEEFEYREAIGSSISANYDFENDYRLRYIAGYRENRFGDSNDEDFTVLDALNSQFNEKSTQYNHEIRLVSPRVNRFDYVVGFSYLSESIEASPELKTGDHSGLMMFVVEPDGLKDLLHSNINYKLFSGDTDFASTIGKVGAKSGSAYFHGNYQVSDNFILGASLRYIYENKDLNYHIEEHSGLGDRHDVVESRSFSKLLPMFGISYEWNKFLTFYTNAAKGFKSGGWHTDTIIDQDRFAYDSETAFSYEVGLSAAWHDMHRLDVTAFKTKFKNYPVFKPVETFSDQLLNPKLGIVGQRVKTQGLETNSYHTLSGGLAFSVNIAYTEAVIDDKNSEDLYFSPHLSYSLSLDYEKSLSRGVDFSFNINHLNVGENRALTFEYSEIPERYKSNVSSSIVFNNAWEVGLWVHNITNEENVIRQSTSFFGVIYENYQAPRSYGLSIRYTFEA